MQARVSGLGDNAAQRFHNQIFAQNICMGAGKAA
jgi:hypothetical protein